MQINLVFDSNALAAPASFRNAIQAAANLLDAAFTDAIVVNLSVGYGEITTHGLTDTVTSESAEAEPLTYGLFSYSSIRSLLTNSVESAVLSGVQALPTTSTFQGRSTVQVWSAEEKALGLIAPTGAALDGAVGFATDIPVNDLVAVALHELTHAMGRSAETTLSPDVFDLDRFTGVGTRLVNNNVPSPAAYFSLNGGVTDIADYGQSSDNSDFLSPSSGGFRTPNDSFNEFYNSNTVQTLTSIDILQMQALGFHTQSVPFTAVSDLFWQNSAGTTAVWELSGLAAAASVSLPNTPGWQIQDSGDFNGDGLRADLVLRNATTGMVDIWTDVGGHMSGADVTVVTPDWNIMGAADFNGDGKSDILWRNETNGYVSIWLMNGSKVQSTWNPGQVGLEWQVVGDGDYNGDGRADVLWRNALTGELDIWTMNPTTGQASGAKVSNLGLQWHVIGQGDFNGDGKTDILWRDSGTGQVVIWEMSGAQVQGAVPIAQLGSQWQLAGVVDVNGDGKADIVWRDGNTNQVVTWTLSGSGVTGAAAIGSVDPTWLPVNHHFDWI